MTIIVWDGKILAADKQATTANLRKSCNKIRKINDNLCGVTGDFDVAEEIFHWYAQGAKQKIGLLFSVMKINVSG